MSSNQLLISVVLEGVENFLIASIICYTEPSEVHASLCKLELVRVEENAGLAHVGEEINCPPLMLFNAAVIMDGVINTSFFSHNFCQDGIKAAIVTVPGGEEPPRCPCVLPVAEWGVESG